MKNARSAPLDLAHGLELAGIVAAVVIAVMANVLSARHFKRWDWTQSGRWSLSTATADTLRGLDRPVEVWAIAGAADPLEQSLRPILTTYGAMTPKLEVHWIDPDRDAAKIIDLQRRFELGVGHVEDGRAATDAIVIVASGSRHWFLTPADMFESSDDDKTKKPREERALTQAIRSVLGGDKAKLCFTAGHGELAIDAPEEKDGLGNLRGLLVKSNYDLSAIDIASDSTPFAECSVVIVAGPRAAMSHDEVLRLRDWLLQGGSLLAAVGPMEASTDVGMAPAGLDDALDPFGIGLDDDLIHDIDPSATIAGTRGEGFFATALPHAVTTPLVASDANGHCPRAAVFFARSLRSVTGPDSSVAVPLFVSSAKAFAKRSIAGAADWTDVPLRAPGDPDGPFAVAMASERPRARPDARRGPRVVVVGSRFALASDNWAEPRSMHGMAFFVDNAISWLASRPAILDIPERADVPAGVRISEEGLGEVRRYVLVFMPLAAALLGVAVWAFRRSAENKPYTPKANEGRAS